MAKVSCNYMDTISTMKMEQLDKPLIFVVDMINGFVKEGDMSDYAIFDIVEGIQQLLDYSSPSVFICDGHTLDCKEFNSFPIHCVKGTEESAVIDELLPYVKTKFYKNSTNAFTAKEVYHFIEENIQQYRDIVIVGCCTDICILQLALSINTYLNENNLIDHRVLAPINLLETYHIDALHDAMKFNEMACTLMQLNGIHVVELQRSNV